MKWVALVSCPQHQPLDHHRGTWGVGSVRAASQGVSNAPRGKGGGARLHVPRPRTSLSGTTSPESSLLRLRFPACARPPGALRLSARGRASEARGAGPRGNAGRAPAAAKGRRGQTLWRVAARRSMPAPRQRGAACFSMGSNELSAAEDGDEVRSARSATATVSKPRWARRRGAGPAGPRRERRRRSGPLTFPSAAAGRSRCRSPTSAGTTRASPRRLRAPHAPGHSSGAPRGGTQGVVR